MVEFDSGVGSALRVEAAKALAELQIGGVKSARILSGGGSNDNLLVDCDQGQVVLRIAEANVARFRIDRARGEQAHRLAADAGIAPELLASLPCGHSVTRFIGGRCVDAAILREPGILEQIGDTLRRLHYAGEIRGSYSIFEELRDWAAIARRERLPLPADFEDLMAAADRVEAALAQLHLSPKLCHNDVQLQNFISEPERLWLVDFEYAGMGNPYFDLGMLFANGELTPNEESILLRSYFGVLREADRARAKLLSLLSALRDATWAVIAAPVKADSGDLFDYPGWALEYYGRSRRFVASDEFGRALDSV